MKKFVKILAIATAVIATASCCGSNAEKNVATDNDNNTIMNQSSNFIFEADTPWDDAGGGVVRQVLGYNDNIMMVKVKFKKGQEGAMHTHPHSQVTYVASGKFEFTIGGVTKIVEAGDALYKQPGIEHGCVCLEDGILIDCFNPMRENFINKK